uniref:Glycoside hydrolase family 38 N-terminal domain-containing protein n=1 Tax=Acrobeloides nanus TaxID=290746 RepID=A0A914CEG0_9BILA
MRGTLLGALLSTLLVTRIFSDTCTWNNCNEWDNDPTVINVHVVPHTHDDMGWKKTADDYYTGAHPPGTAEVIYPGVQYVINTVLNELSKDPARRFSYCETGYLTRWLEEPTQLRNPKQVQKLKNFVTNGNRFG